MTTKSGKVYTISVATFSFLEQVIPKSEKVYTIFLHVSPFPEQSTPKSEKGVPKRDVLSQLTKYFIRFGYNRISLALTFSISPAYCPGLCQFYAEVKVVPKFVSTVSRGDRRQNV